MPQICKKNKNGEPFLNHIFEHAIIASSEKYPGKDLFFDLIGKTYNTYVNAFTYLPFTIYPVGSQSEEQLLLMADAYLSCMVSPDLLHDERFFRREALRYMLYDVEEPISMGGTDLSACDDPVSAPGYVEEVFYAPAYEGDSAEDAAAFKSAVDSTLSDIAGNGLDEELVETVLKTKRLDDYTTLEYTDVIIEEVFPLICMKWAQTGETDILLDNEDAFLTMQQDTQHTLIRKLADTLKNAPHSAMVTTTPKPGLAEQILAEQEAYLVEMKASMTPEELEQMVKDTLAFDEWNASEQSNSDIVIPVKDLPEPEPAAEFAKENVDGAVYYAAASDLEKISLHRIQFDTSAVPQEDLCYINLYSILLEELAAGNYDRAEKDNLMASTFISSTSATSIRRPGKINTPCSVWNGTVCGGL